MKKKMAKRGLIGNGLLLLIAIISVAATTHITDVSGKPGNDSIQQLSFDTLLLKLNGVSGSDMLNAPAIQMNKKAITYVNGYIADNTDLLEDIKSRSNSYFKIADAVFKKYSLPQELKYLAVVESELKTTALSPVGARGAWQLMPETARLLSLKVTAKYDERTHYYKSTVAAAKYLRDLHAIFGDWLLVIAAYNTGPANVFAAIKKSGSRNFWSLQKYLPDETKGHVKKFVAVHYYFEGKGSVATLTKAEANEYRKLMKEFVTKQNALLSEGQVANNNDTIVINGEVAKAETNQLSSFNNKN